MKHIEINNGTWCVGVGVGITDQEESKDRWEGQLIEYADRIDGMAVFVGWRRFRSHMECVEFIEKQIPVSQFHRFIDIVSYLQFVTGETMLTVESHQYEVRAANVRKKKEK